MNIHGAFLCFGANAEPGVVLLGMSEMEFMHAKMAIAETRCKDVATARANVYAQYFGKGVEYAVPCWSQEAMIAIAQDYKGPHSERIRGLAACIALGKTYGADGNQDGPKGGQDAPIDPVKPKPTKPRGGARMKVDAAVTA